MNISRVKRIFVICAYLGPMVCGLGVLATRAGAQPVMASAVNRSYSVADSAAEGSASMADDDLRQRVKHALHADPYFYDEHVTVSVEDGRVVLRGFVSSDWDIRDAIRIASKAAGGKRVVDDLTIKLGGNR
jgi:osmotically-inducible protein OsmY